MSEAVSQHSTPEHAGDSRCSEEIYEMEGDFSRCRGAEGHAGPHWSGSWRWTKPGAAIDEADYAPYAQPEEWHLDSAQPATMAALRGLGQEITVLADRVSEIGHNQHELTCAVLRPMIGLQIGVNRLLAHLGAPVATDADIDEALRITPDADEEDEDEF